MPIPPFQENDMDITLNKPFAANIAVDEFDVRRMKKALNRLGYYSPYEKTGITGIPDAAVFSALKSFQKDQGLQPTGTARPGDGTVSKLSSEAARKKSGQYIWRTVGDGKVRDSHAKLSGTLRDLADSPDPGEEFNCRCWAEFKGLKLDVLKTDCDEEREKYEELQHKVRALTERFHDLLLQLNELRQEHNSLLESTKKALGAQIVSYILTLPFERLDALNELLRRYFGNIINNRLLEVADSFMQQLWGIKQKIQYFKDQRNLVLAQLERATKELEEAKKKLEECKNHAKTA
ncbi:MAG: peptidoglycan-binding protein [Alphaproteobacteria bacterium]